MKITINIIYLYNKKLYDIKEFKKKIINLKHITIKIITLLNYKKLYL